MSTVAILFSVISLVEYPPEVKLVKYGSPLPAEVMGALNTSRMVQPGEVLQVMLPPELMLKYFEPDVKATWGKPSLDCSCSEPEPSAVPLKPGAVPVLGQVVTSVPKDCVAASVRAE